MSSVLYPTYNETPKELKSNEKKSCFFLFAFQTKVEMLDQSSL